MSENFKRFGIPLILFGLIIVVPIVYNVFDGIAERAVYEKRTIEEMAERGQTYTDSYRLSSTEEYFVYDEDGIIGDIGKLMNRKLI